MLSRAHAGLRQSGSSYGSSRLLGLCVLLLLGGCEPLLPEGPEGPGDGGIEDRVTELVNDYRETLGCRRLVWDPRLADVAREHSADMLTRAYFGHTTPDGKGLPHRLRVAGIRYSIAAENIAQGYRYEDAAQKVVTGWIESESHRQIIANCDFASHGVGFVDYRWTHLFMR